LGAEDEVEMNSENLSQFAVYNIMRYFSKQPGDIGHCPVCGSHIGVTCIPPSKKVAKDLDDFSLIPVHYFSRLYACSDCSWSAVRESWAYYECNSTMDYLIVRVEESNSQLVPWDQLLQNDNIYRNIKSLPEGLGRLFMGGTKAIQWSTIGYIIADAMVHKSLLDNDCTLLLPQGSQVSIINFEIYKVNFMQQQSRDRYWSRKPLNQKLIEDMLHKVEQKIRHGDWYAVRLEKLGSGPIEKSGINVICKQGEIYLVEVSNVDRRVN
jgi:hypothetical protein